MTVRAGHPGPLNALVIVSSRVFHKDWYSLLRQWTRENAIYDSLFKQDTCAFSPLFSLSLSPYSRIQIQCLRFLVLLARLRIRLLLHPGWKAFPALIGSNVTAQLRDIEPSSSFFDDHMKTSLQINSTLSYMYMETWKCGLPSWFLTSSHLTIPRHQCF
jgi:hypothetical protein